MIYKSEVETTASRRRSSGIGSLWLFVAFISIAVQSCCTNVPPSGARQGQDTREATTDDGDKEKYYCSKPEFRPFFKTRKEQIELEKYWNTYEQAEIIKHTKLENCSFSCPAVSVSNSSSGATSRPTYLSKELPRAKIGCPEGDPVYRDADEEIPNSCCLSRLVKKELEWAETPLGEHVDIVQCDWMKQFFFIEECRQASGCTGCNCTRKFGTVMAVIDQGPPKGHGLSYIKIPVCCQCYNIKPKCL